MSDQDPREPIHPAPDTEYPPEEQALPESVPKMQHRLTDAQAIAALLAFWVFRIITQQVGRANLPRLLGSPWMWTVPLLNNTTLMIMSVATEARGDPGMLLGTGLASFTWSLVSGLVLYWAGYRFGPELAVRAEKEGSMWASIWNPKQVAVAHAWIEKYGFIAVALGRLSGRLTTPVVLVAGSTRMSLRKFLPSYAMGSIGYAGIALWLGILAGDRWPWIPARIKSLAPWSVRITFALLALTAIALLLSRKQEQPPDTTGKEG